MKSRLLPSFLALGGMLCIASFQVDAAVGSMKSVGMGGGGVAYPQDALAGAYNPAGMSQIPDRFDFNVSYAHYDNRARVSGSPVPGANGNFSGSSTHNIYGFYAGINKNFCFNLCDNCFNVTLGIVEYERARLKTKYHFPNPLAGVTPLQFDYTQAIVAPVLTISINQNHAIGIAIDGVGQRLRINGIENFDNPVFSLFPGHVTNRQADYSFGIGATIGYLGNFFCDWLTVGVSYQPEIQMSRFHNYKGFLADHGKVKVPELTVVGFAVHLPYCINVCFDYEYYRFRQVAPVHNPLVANLLDPDTLLGSKKGTGFGWRNQSIYRVGVDYTLCDWTIRAGYRHQTGVIRKSQTFTNILTCNTNEDIVTGGLSWRPWCNVELTAAYVHVFKKKVKGRHAIPALIGGGNVDLEQTINFVGVGFGYCF